ncbi:hypothetical protein EJK55_1955 [Moraxella catarrhalis]|uniref:Uncharacterized protein n=1 Tax=Moraxella catarrhalis TaxID=480 RepID=A0A3Q9GAI2_MORCA|nr:hypothetical protein MCR_1167 [Moraxella catarrhalis BBH18]AZQ86537.1 hypothetical protein EJK52_1222 [Moraxella catarrhalis]AZQ88814.1 hypothetical protein EJK50_1274 [Moraxella catarrhalis]AZQ91108.1 hypothetical protein EJK51_1220 [Moraxella catarrhalis]AZQ92661.1 hypothetical protein EJK53_1297 [Moraxella catarrhalis]
MIRHQSSFNQNSKTFATDIMTKDADFIDYLKLPNSHNAIC